MIDEYVFRSKYARYNKKEKRRESWSESVDRMMDMHYELFPNMKKEIDACREAMKEKKITGSQRALQFGGSAILEKNMRLYNCVSSYADRPRFFAESLWLLLCGCGVGFSVQRHHVDKLPSIQETGYPYKHTIEDSIEGWADAVNALCESYFFGKGYPWFDFSRIRPKGAPLRFGGSAPGHKPLADALDKIDELLKSRLYSKLRSIDVFDCVMYLADSVLTAGIRRAATIATFDIEDEDMLHSKTGNWFETNPQRGRANISAIATPQTTYESFERIFEATKQFGEPAIIFLESTEFTVNPCVEIIMCPTLIKKDGDIVEHYSKDLLDPARRDYYEKEGYTFESGWQACNLSSINGAKAQTRKDFYEAAKLASILGTLQSAYINSGYLGETSKKIIQRESLLGVSICGVMDSPEVCLNESVLRKGAKIVKDTNAKVAKKLGIPLASRTTCIKPEGTTSIVLGASSGIHPHHAKRYIRRVQANEDEPIFRAFERKNPHAVEDSVWGADKVVSFAIEAPEDAILKSDLDAVYFMSLAKIVYENWVCEGTHVDRLEGATHNVSITVTVKPYEWVDVQHYLWENRDSFCGVSFLSSTGDYDYPQAPYQEVYRDFDKRSEIYKGFLQWEKLKEHTKFVDYDRLYEGSDNTKPLENAACVGGVCEIL